MILVGEEGPVLKKKVPCTRTEHINNTNDLSLDLSIQTPVRKHNATAFSALPVIKCLFNCLSSQYAIGIVTSA